MIRTRTSEEPRCQGLSHLAGLVLVARHFCSGPAASWSGSPARAAQPATNQEPRGRCVKPTLRSESAGGAAHGSAGQRLFLLAEQELAAVCGSLFLVVRSSDEIGGEHGSSSRCVSGATSLLSARSGPTIPSSARCSFEISASAMRAGLSVAPPRLARSCGRGSFECLVATIRAGHQAAGRRCRTRRSRSRFGCRACRRPGVDRERLTPEGVILSRPRAASLWHASAMSECLARVSARSRVASTPMTWAKSAAGDGGAIDSYDPCSSACLHSRLIGDGRDPLPR